MGRVNEMCKSKLPAALLAMGFIAIGQAAEEGTGNLHEFSGNIGLYSQYVFRGLTQTDEHFAVQGGIDYSHANGFYAGTWASNISWFSDLNPGNSVSLEWDAYTGFKKSWANAITADIGYLRYEYPGSYPALASGILKPNTDEFYLGFGWKWATLKYSYATSDLFGVPDSDGSSYVDLTVNIPLPQSFGLALHAGQQNFAGSINDALFAYEDYRASVTYGLSGGWSAAATFTHSTAKDVGYTVLNENIGADQFVFAVSRVL
jgi:uncharacterized protein (TIGR02001 family)